MPKCEDLAALGFPDCGKELGLLFRPQIKSFIAFVRQHRHDCPFGQTLPIQLNRAVVNSASRN